MWVDEIGVESEMREAIALHSTNLNFIIESKWRPYYYYYYLGRKIKNSRNVMCRRSSNRKPLQIEWTLRINITPVKAIDITIFM